MAMTLTQDQTMLRDTVAPFLADEGGVALLRRLREQAGPGHEPALWARFTDMGLPGLMAPEEAGGLGLGHVEAGLVLEEIGRTLTPSPFLVSSVGAVTALKAGGPRPWLERIAAGAAIGTLAIDEGPKHRPEQVALKATRSGNGFALDGAKTFVPFGHGADVLIVAARTSGDAGQHEGITLFAVPADSAGLTRDSHRLVDGSLAADLRFEKVNVDGDAVIGTVDQGWSVLRPVLDAVRCGAAAELLGVGGGTLAMTLDYLKTRKQFGRVIGSFQALQHRAAHLYGEMELARAAVLKAQQLLDAQDPRAEYAVAVAKAKAGQATGLAVREGLQMHGGIGMTDEHDIGLYMKRDRVLQEYAGDAAYHTDRVARLIGY